MQKNEHVDLKNAKTPSADANVGADELRQVLADTFVLYMKTYAIHWNYAGAKFFSVHKLTETQYEELAEAIDEIAERIRAKGVLAPISLADILSSADIDEMKRQTADDQALMDLAKSHTLLSERAKSAAKVLEDANDLFSCDMLVARSGAHEKAAWMLRSFLQTPATDRPQH